MEKDKISFKNFEYNTEDHRKCRAFTCRKSGHASWYHGSNGSHPVVCRMLLSSPGVWQCSKQHLMKTLEAGDQNLEELEPCQVLFSSKMDPMSSPEKQHLGSDQKKNYVQSNVCAKIYMVIIMQNLQQLTILPFSDSAHTIKA